MMWKCVALFFLVRVAWNVIRAFGAAAWQCSEPDLYALDQNMRIARGEGPLDR